MPLELAASPRGEAVAPPGGGLILCGADLVHLAEGLQLRIFRLTGGLVLVGSLVALLLGVLSGGASNPSTIAAALGGLTLAVRVLQRPLTSYVWLRRGSARRGAVVAMTMLAVLTDGVDGPSWWVAVTVLVLLSTVSSTRFAVLAGLLVALAFVAGALIAGGSLARHGADAGVLAGASGLPANALLGRVVCEGFARLVLSLHRVEVAARTQPEPLRRPVVVSAVDASVAADVAPPPPRLPPGRRTGVNRLTVRQLEVALLARDGLRQPEIADALGLSVTQVERHLRQARERIGAANLNELVARLVTDGLVAPPVGAAAPRADPDGLDRPDGK